jgi:hypothetical protein
MALTIPPPAACGVAKRPRRRSAWWCRLVCFVAAVEVIEQAMLCCWQHLAQLTPLHPLFGRFWRLSGLHGRCSL